MRPKLVRSPILLRSNSAKTAVIWNMSFPTAVVVSNVE